MLAAMDRLRRIWRAPGLDPVVRLGLRLAHRLLRVWWAIRRPRAEGAAVAVWWEGRLLVVESSYRPGLWDLPGGGRGAGESADAAARRELFEETGLAPEPGALEEAGAVEFALEGRRIRTRILVWRPKARVAPRVDRREILRAEFRTPEELARSRLAPGLRLYLEGPAQGAGRAGGAGGSTPPQTRPT
ncbi:MAG: NUDIX hydrolase [Geminicoccaceae bacterium]|nr:NUDIX hydrolase [Geminicoccaceae bacterium]